MKLCQSNAETWDWGCSNEPDWLDFKGKLDQSDAEARDWGCSHVPDWLDSILKCWSWRIEMFVSSWLVSLVHVCYCVSLFYFNSTVLV